MNTVSERKVRLLIDMNSIVNQSMLGGTDEEFGIVIQHPETGKDVKINSAIYTVDRFLERYHQALEHFDVAPVDVIGVWDGKGGKMYRQNFLPQYKAGRDKLPQQHEVLNDAKNTINNFLRFLGTTIVEQTGCEADDTLAYLAKHLTSTHNIIYTGDGDLTVLVDDNTSVWRMGELDKNPYGPFPFKHVLTYKSLVGDTSDKIPGARGFGDKAFVKLVNTFGLEGLDQMLEEIEGGTLSSLKENIPDLPELKKVVEDEAGVTNSWRAAKLYPNRVNANRRPIDILPGFCHVDADIGDMVDYRPMFAKYWPAVKLVSAENYEQALEHFKKHAPHRFELALDIETSTPEESDEWLELRGKTEGVDVLGSKLTGMSLTYGCNLQYTVYMAVDHVEEPGVSNITVDQCREWCEAIPEGTHIIIQNRSFEFAVLWNTWGEKWKDNGWYGFVPNAYDTAVEASYVDENLPRGLKERTKLMFGYDQVTYKEVTGGKKMNQLTARHVLSYGADDTICTAALHTYYRIVMEMEDTWKVYEQVELIPEYLTSLAYVQGIRYSKKRLREIEEEDKIIFDAAWRGFEEYLVEKGWDGSICPVHEEITPAATKEAYLILTGEEFTSRKRKLDALAQEIREASDYKGSVDLLASAVENGDVALFNKVIADHFDGKPKFNFNSTTQKQTLFYRTVGMTPRLLNKLTDKQREDSDMRTAFGLFREWQDNPNLQVEDKYRKMWISKASTDEDAVELALTMDNLPEREQNLLKAYSELRKVETRTKMFYEPYRHIAHWKDGKLHPELIQCEAATRRYSSRNPNIQQLPSRGEGLKFREIILPHHKDAVILSADWSGQELRLMADECRDENMLACFVGDNKKDMHSLTAAAAAPVLWNEAVTYDDFVAMRKAGTPEEMKKAEALRGNGKECNFSSQYGARAPKLAVILKSSVEEAQAFLDAKEAAFPGIAKWKERYESECQERGYALTKLGARRHLRGAFNSDDKWTNLKAERQASNYIIQGSGAEMCKLSMKTMWEMGIFTKFDCRFIAPIHDEVCVSVHKDQVAEVAALIHEAMTQQYADMYVPLESEIAIGLNLGDLKVIGTEPDEQHTKEVIKELFAD